MSGTFSAVRVLTSHHIETPVSFEANNCWDCPIQASSLAWTILITTVLLALGVWLLARRHSGLRVVGAVVIAPTVLFLLAAARVFPRWGISWSVGDPVTWPIHPTLDRVVVYSWVASSVLAVVIAWRRLGRRT
jgi:hypothetical protein